MSKTVAYLTSCCLLLGTAAAWAQNPVGEVESARGTANITRSSDVISAVEDTPLATGDALSTGSNSALRFGMADGSSHALGEDGSLQIDEFVYDPNNPSANRMVFSLLRGSLQSLGGAIGAGGIGTFIVKTPFGEYRGGDLDLRISVNPSPTDGQLVIENSGGPGEVVSNGVVTPVPSGTTVVIRPDGSVTIRTRPREEDEAGEGEAGVEIDLRIEPRIPLPSVLPTLPVGTPTPNITLPPTGLPTATPVVTLAPTPTVTPASTPTPGPTTAPTGTPSGAPSGTPSPTNVGVPTVTPTDVPVPTALPTATGSPAPTAQPTVTLTPPPSVQPTATVTPSPSTQPTATLTPPPTVPSPTPPSPV